MTGDRHLDWCKMRALHYVDSKDLTGAFRSLLSDMKKHEETAVSVDRLTISGMQSLLQGEVGMRKWIQSAR